MNDKQDKGKPSQGNGKNGVGMGMPMGTIFGTVAAVITGA